MRLWCCRAGGGGELSELLVGVCGAWGRLVAFDVRGKGVGVCLPPIAAKTPMS